MANRKKVGDYSDKLTRREIEALQYLVDFRGNYRKIAEKMVISETTLKTHINNIYGKLQVSDKVGAVLEGYRRGLITIAHPETQNILFISA